MKIYSNFEISITVQKHISELGDVLVGKALGPEPSHEDGATYSAGGP